MSLQLFIERNLDAKENDILRLLISAMKIVEQRNTMSGEQKKQAVLDALTQLYPDKREWLSEQIELICEIGKVSIGISKVIKDSGCFCSK